MEQHPSRCEMSGAPKGQPYVPCRQAAHWIVTPWLHFDGTLACEEHAVSTLLTSRDYVTGADDGERMMLDEDGELAVMP